MKVCCQCKKRRQDSSFHKRKGGLQARCKKCNNDYRRIHRTKNETYRQNNTRATREARLQLPQEVEALKAETPCKDCGQSFNPWQLQFDHVRGVKVGNIANLVSQGKRNAVYLEIQKCEIVCANCHADRTHYRAIATVV